MNFSQQTESAEDRTKLYMENNPSLKLRAELLLTWLKDVGEVDEDTTLEDVIFVGDFYDLDRFSVEGSEYSVGDEDEVRKSCEESIRDQIYSEGLQVFNKDFLKSHIDEKDVKRYAEDFFSQDIYEYPEAYFDDSERMLSRKQREQLDILLMKMNRLEQSIKQFEQGKKGPNADWFNKKISEFEEIIDEYSIEITEIQEDPQGDFPDELVDNMVEEKMKEVNRDPWDFIESYDVDWEQFVDTDSMIEEAIDTDGYGHYLATYDGEAHEVYDDGDLFYIMRID
tara:strand:+ start:3641 stop:4486 length:846 start_codon:yes stop_codon:yes gene_type:complete